VLAGLSETNPHIVRITDAGEYEGIPYYCMEYLPKGVPKKTSLKEAVNIIYQAGCGLEAAHSVEFDYVDHTGKKYRVKGVTHRDIKPENLRIGVDGKVKVTDWGLAAIRSSEVTRLSRTGMIVGTPMYMSPEQIMGDKVDPKTDVFSLGLVFYELLTGTLPWGLTKKTMEEIQGLHFKLAGYPPELIKQARPSSRVKVPQAIDDIVYLMLQPDKKKRPTMTEVLDALRDYGKGEGSSSFGERLSQVDARIKSVQKERWWQRNKGKVVVGIILAAVIGVILTYLGTRETPQERRRKEAVALYNEHLALYRDAESEANRNPESALEKFKLFVQRVKDLQESNRDVEFESVEEKLSSAEEALKRLKREVESKRLRKEAEAKYEGLLKIFESAENDDKEGKETSAVGYQNFIEQAEALKKQYSDIEFKEIEALLEKARRRKSEYDSKISERKRQEEARKKAEEILKRVMLASSIEEKLKLYDEAIAADSSYALIYIQKGELLVSENRLEEALKVFEKGLEVAKQNSDVSGQALAHYKIGLTLWKDLMKQELALDHFKKIKELLPDVRNEMTIFADAIDAWQKCDFDKANGLFGEVLKLNPRMTDALFNRACVRVNKGDYDGAIEDCSKILELNPKDVWALRERGMVKRMKGDYEGAITDYSRILEFPEFSDDWKKTVWLFRAETYNQMGRYKESAQEYEKLVLLEPRNCNFWYEFARVCCKAGDKKRALEALLKMIEVDASGEMKKLVKGEPDFEPLRSDPTFKKLFLDEEPKPK
jgi:tetratricopeptide (TPR) repeat protein